MVTISSRYDGYKMKRSVRCLALPALDVDYERLRDEFQGWGICTSLESPRECGPQLECGARTPGSAFLEADVQEVTAPFCEVWELHP